MPSRLFAGALVGVLVAAISPAEASDRWEAGLRVRSVHAQGEPADDMVYLGAIGSYRFRENWYVGFGVEKVEYDFERPAIFLDLKQDPNLPAIDAEVTGTLLSGWVEREYGRPESKTRWFWSAGLGLDAPSAERVGGPLAGGAGSFDIESDVGLEIVTSGGGGVRWTLARHWKVELAGRVDYYLADWKVEDRVSGRTGSIGTYAAPGAHFGVSYRF